ncbi:MAG TPA: adenine phosphoribosyltransferase [Cytophagaceae bacterium]|jgi:adenine phosphoribosyltransferase|nr:adenine phosphoribosyltransferase [Cytophagaceae bacterium]
MDIVEALKNTIRDVPDFPKKGIVFKDLTSILKDPKLCLDITSVFCDKIRPLAPDAIVALDSRGFWFALLIATRLGVPMIPVRKEGKLPYKTIAKAYSLEYGTSKVEMHIDALQPGWKVFIHDDLLATGGTAAAASSLVLEQSAHVCGYGFIVELDSLEGRGKLKEFSENIVTLIHY